MQKIYRFINSRHPFLGTNEQIGPRLDIGFILEQTAVVLQVADISCRVGARDIEFLEDHSLKLSCGIGKGGDKQQVGDEALRKVEEKLRADREKLQLPLPRLPARRLIWDPTPAMIAGYRASAARPLRSR